MGENEGFWLGEGIRTPTAKEAEQLRLKQLQIEQEVLFYFNSLKFLQYICGVLKAKIKNKIKEKISMLLNMTKPIWACTIYRGETVTKKIMNTLVFFFNFPLGSYFLHLKYPFLYNILIFLVL